MKTIGIVAVAAAMLATPVFAQATPQTLSPTGTEVLEPEGIQPDPMDFNQFVEEFGSADFTASYDELDSATSVHIVKLSGMPNASLQSFQDGFASRADDVAGLVSRLENNPMATAALEGAGVTLDQVVAIEASGDGAVTLYVNDLS